MSTHTESNENQEIHTIRFHFRAGSCYKILTRGCGYGISHCCHRNRTYFGLSARRPHLDRFEFPQNLELYVILTEENVSLVVAHSSQIWIYISASVFLHCMSDLLQICLFKLLNDSHNFNPITNMTLFNLKRLFYIITTMLGSFWNFFFLNKCLRFVRLIWLFIPYLYLNIVT